MQAAGHRARGLAKSIKGRLVIKDTWVAAQAS